MSHFHYVVVADLANRTYSIHAVSDDQALTKKVAAFNCTGRQLRGPSKYYPSLQAAKNDARKNYLGFTEVASTVG